MGGVFRTIFVLIFAFSWISLQAQEKCEVVHENLKGEYRGECRKGLAHGYGEAQGKDHYIGEFRRGYPHGNGTYTWSTGEKYEGELKKGLRDGEGTYYFFANGKDSVIYGKWIDDKYVGVYHERPYNVDFRNNIGRVSFVKMHSNENYVRLKFMRNGTENTNISNVLLSGDSGTQNTDRMFTGHEHVNFPFKGKVSFSAPNAFNSAMLNCELRYKIFEPGAWVISITY